jgi:hypothetical protein
MNVKTEGLGFEPGPPEDQGMLPERLSPVGGLRMMGR